MSGLCMAPTSMRPSGVMARPSMPLLATRPAVLFGANSPDSVALTLATANLTGSAYARSRRPVCRSELVDIGTVLVRDEHVLPVVRDANAFGIESRIVRIRRRTGHEVIRSSREVVAALVVERGLSAAGDAAADAVGEVLGAPQQG